MGSRRIDNLCGALGLLGALAGCGRHEVPEVSAARTSALSRALAAEDTFINSALPDNNNGHSASIYTGRNGQSGDMRALIKFTMPPDLQGRVTVTGAQLTMTTRGLSSTGTAAPTVATESLQAVIEAWNAGNGESDDGPSMHIPGQACGGAIVGATWSRPDCAPAASWTTPGGTVSGAISGQASVPAAIDTAVTWTSPAMVADVQGWIDAPASNHGWRITSSTEGGGGGLAQRFYSSEAVTAHPSLVVNFTACTATALSACQASIVGNGCLDEATPSGLYRCVCGNAAYTLAPSADACIDRGSPDTGDAAGPDDAGGTGGAAGTAGGGEGGGGEGGGGEGGGAGGTAGTIGPNQTGGDSGCSCAVPGRGPHHGVLVSLSIVAATWMARRRRAKR